MKFFRDKMKRGDARAPQKTVLALPIFDSARSVALYMPIRGEAATDRLLQEALARGKTVYLPRLLPDRQMEFAPLASLDGLETGPMGILQPAKAIAGLCAPEFETDLMFMPGLAFDRGGNRLGYGGGYYDRFLGKFPGRGWPLIGLGYDFQIVENIPAMPWDVRVDYICGENCCIAPNNALDSAR